MDYIHKLPFLLGTGAAIIIGAVSFGGNIENRGIYLRMAIGMIAFYFIGYLIRSMLEKTIEELEEKKRQEEIRLEEERKAKEQEEALRKEAEADDNQEASPKVDYRTTDDDFAPFTVSEVIHTKEK